MIANFHMCGIKLVLEQFLTCESKRAYVFILSGPCELLFLLSFYCLLDLSCGECNVISLYFVCCSVGVSVCLVCL